MGIPAINYYSLANMKQMEDALYHGTSGFGNCPSYTNGYMSNMNGFYPSVAYNPSFYGNTPYGYNSIYGNDSIYNSSYPQTSSAQQTPAFGASQEDLDILGKYYAQGLTPSESFAGAAIGGVTFAMMNNPRSVVHWCNFLGATSGTDKIFAGIKNETSDLYKLWRGAGTTDIMQEAYARMHKLEALKYGKFGKLGLFRKSVTPEKYEALKKVMTDALNFQGSEAEKIKKIAEATELIKKETNAFTGHIPNLLRKMGLQKPMTSLRKHINGSQYQGVAEVAAKNVAESGNAFSLTKHLKKSCGVKSGLFFAGIELLLGLPNIIEAFKTQNMTDAERAAQGLSNEKYSNAGWKQLGQTAIKGLGNAAGWCIGEGIGAWAGAKLGAMAGTAIAPGIGTAIGAVAGLVGGSIGMWLMGKVTHKVVGQDIAEKIKVDKMKSTPQGQAELLQLTMQQAQSDKNLDAKTAQAIQNVYSVYAS